MDNIKQICIELANLAKREHYFCEDSWYSCPKAEGGCANDAEGDECVCGADANNAKVNELLAAALARTEPEGPTDEEIMELMPQQMRDDLAAAARAMSGFDPDNIKAASVFRIILNRHAVDHARAVLARWGK